MIGSEPVWLVPLTVEVMTSLSVLRLLRLLLKIASVPVSISKSKACPIHVNKSMRAGFVLGLFCGLLAVSCGARVNHGKVDATRIATMWSLLDPPAPSDLLSLSFGIRHSVSAKTELQVGSFHAFLHSLHS